eukprot:g60342.t1
MNVFYLDCHSNLKRKKSGKKLQSRNKLVQSMDAKLVALLEHKMSAFMPQFLKKVKRWDLGFLLHLIMAGEVNEGWMGRVWM